MSKLSDLAERSDLQLGPMLVSPSRRLVEGPGGHWNVEPLIMQVFLLLLDARGKVVTRDQLFDQVWGGVIVGDDSLNRAIGKVRRIEADVAPGLFEIETIPRTGYRLTGEVLDCLGQGAAGEDDGGQRRQKLSRRTLLASALGAGALAGAAYWLLGRDRPDPRSAELVEKGRQALIAAQPDSDEIARRHLREAIRIDSDNSEAWGLLALTLRNMAEESPSSAVSQRVLEAEGAARRALALDRKDPNARTALATLRPEFGRWAEVEDALRLILRDAPDNGPALAYLTMLLQAVGRARESFVLNERVAALEPLSPVHQFRRALKLWILGRNSDADLRIDQALQLWPRHPAVWNARMMIFAFTGRPGAALAMVDDAADRPAFPDKALDNWRASLRALASRADSDIAAARRANVAAARISPAHATWGMMAQSALGEVDAAFEIAETTLLRRGKSVGNISGGQGGFGISDQFWRRTMNLFTPATAAMRADPRFKDLCEGIGMLRYWRARGIGPDPMYRLTFV
ncbi:MAG TPA: winged helix-turn-helix domain-containing protein [Sphingomicrobium sp.]|nr:winged helix-turn-helix domain-containing protein [Sphingomicrobium sp.]